MKKLSKQFNLIKKRKFSLQNIKIVRKYRIKLCKY